METTNLTMQGPPGFWTFVFVHPFMAFLLAALMIVGVFGAITDIFVAFASMGRKK